MDCTCRNPIFCVVPPYVLTQVARRGSEKQREWALRSLDADITIRHARAVNAKARGRKGPVEGPDALAAAAGPGVRNRIIWDARNKWEVTGLRRVRDEDDGPTGDPAVDEAFDGFGDTWGFWQDVFNRDSIDNETGLEYWGQSGALNEHFADVAGIMVKQRKLGQTADQADWLIGAELRGEEFDGVALRSMKAPGTAYDDACLGKDPQPAHWRDYVRTWDDNGGVHINSGIPNKAFYLLAKNLGGQSWRKPGRIWYDALRSPQLTTTATFRQFARITHRAARQRFGTGSDEAKAVREAWADVGVRWE